MNYAGSVLFHGFNNLCSFFESLMKNIQEILWNLLFVVKSSVFVIYLMLTFLINTVSLYLFESVFVTKEQMLTYSNDESKNQ